MIARKYEVARCDDCGGVCSKRAILCRDCLSRKQAADQSTGDPTPEEIVQRAAEIRATWDESTRQSRAGESQRNVRAVEAQSLREMLANR